MYYYTNNNNIDLIIHFTIISLIALFLASIQFNFNYFHLFIFYFYDNLVLP